MKLFNFFKYLIILLALLSFCSREQKTDTTISINQDTDWPIFRGDAQLSGVANTVLPENIKLLWTFKTEGDIKSSPVIGQNKIFIGSNDGYIYALNLTNGELLWKFDTGDAVDAPALYRDNTVYVGSLNGWFFALNALNGKYKWKYKTEDQISGSANWVTTSEKENRIVVGSYDNIMHCLDAKTGSRLWENLTATPKERWSTIHFVQNRDKTWMFNERGELIIAKLSPAGFQELSRAKLLAPTRVQLSRRGGVCWAHPAFANKHVFARNDEALVCADLAADN